MHILIRDIEDIPDALDIALQAAPVARPGRLDPPPPQAYAEAEYTAYAMRADVARAALVAALEVWRSRWGRWARKARAN